MAAIMEHRDVSSMQRQTCSSFVKASQRRPFLLSSHIQPGKFCSPPVTATPLPAKANTAALMKHSGAGL